MLFEKVVESVIGENSSSGARWTCKTAILLVAMIVLSLVGLTVFRLACVDFVDNYQLGYMYDLRTGEIQRLDHTGYVVTWPFVQQVHTVDLRPMQVSISANSRILNAKLVQFNPDGVDPVTGQKGLELFLSWHGRNDYEGPGMFGEILKGYAYEDAGKTYPFLTIIRELKTETGQTAPSS